VSRIIDNSTVELADALSAVLPHAHQLDACVGYFNLRGWSHIASAAKKMEKPVASGPKVRLLIGMALSADRELHRELKKLWRSHDADPATTERANDLAQKAVEGFAKQLVWATPSAQDEKGLRELLGDLESGFLEVKFYSRELLHAKLYLVHLGEGAVAHSRGVVGSSNLTNAGLKGQGELNLEETDQQLTAELSQWFNTRWDDTFSIDVSQLLADVLRDSWVAPEQPSPYLIHLKMAYELSEEARSGLTVDIPPAFSSVLLEYQANAVRVANKMLDQRGLVVIGDVVGLGKTMVGSAVAASQAGSTLVICPKNLVAMWEGYFHRFDIPGRIMSISTARRDLPEMRHYGMVIIDESHRLRNKGTKSWDAVKEYVERGNSKVLLMTATMYNAYYSDIAGQLGLKLDFDEPLGLRPEVLIEEIGEMELAKKTGGQLDTLRAFLRSEHNEDWQQLLGIFLIRRTRKFVEENFGRWKPSESGFVMQYPDGAEYRFPRRVPKPLEYQGGPHDPGDKLASPENFDAMAELTYARYRLGRYLKADVPILEGEESELVDDLKRSINSYSGFIRTTALKRLTSSAQAFLMTLDRMLLRSYVLAHALQEGLPLPVGTLANSAYELEDDGPTDDQDFEEIEDGAAETAGVVSGYAGSVRTQAEWKKVAASTYEHLVAKNPPRLRWADPGWFDVESLLSDVASDAKVMQAIISEHGNWDPASDSKLAALADFLNGRKKGQKVLVFSEYKDTIDYVFSHLPAMVPGREIETVSGQSTHPGEIARRFAPVSNGELGGLPEGKSEIEILLATDVLSEGQNLQDADTVINWDLPWTIIPMIQRAGRVDRIGQKAAEISVLSFRPQQGVENVLKLYKRLGNRLRNNAEIFGAGDKFFDDDGVVDDDFIAKLFDGTADLDLDEGDVDYPSFALGIWNVALEGDKKKVLSMQDARYSTMAEIPLHRAGTMAYCITHKGYNVIVSRIGEKSIHLSPLAALRATSVPADIVALPRRKEFFAELEFGLSYAFSDSRDKHFLAVNKGLRKRLYESLVQARDSLEEGSSLKNGVGHIVDALLAGPIVDNAQHAVLAILKSTKNLTDGVDGVDQLLDLHREGRLFKALSGGDTDVRFVCAMGYGTS